MSLMFRNSNTALEKELAAEDYKAHPVRNRLAILAVALCAVLLSITCSVGIGFVRTINLSMGASPGPGADSNSIYGNEEILEKVREQPQVDWAAYVRRCSDTRLHNQEFDRDMAVYRMDFAMYCTCRMSWTHAHYKEVIRLKNTKCCPKCSSGA